MTAGNPQPPLALPAHTPVPSVRRLLYAQQDAPHSHLAIPPIHAQATDRPSHWIHGRLPTRSRRLLLRSSAIDPNLHTDALSPRHTRFAGLVLYKRTGSPRVLPASCSNRPDISPFSARLPEWDVMQKRIWLRRPGKPATTTHSRVNPAVQTGPKPGQSGTPWVVAKDFGSLFGLW